MSSSPSFRQLDEAQIIATLGRLKDRIGERFPGSGLGVVSEQLMALAHETRALVDYLRHPHWPIRIAGGVTIAVMLAVLAALIQSIPLPLRVGDVSSLIQASNAAISDIVFL